MKRDERFQEGGGLGSCASVIVLAVASWAFAAMVAYGLWLLWRAAP